MNKYFITSLLVICLGIFANPVGASIPIGETKVNNQVINVAGVRMYYSNPYYNDYYYYAPGYVSPYYYSPRYYYNTYPYYYRSGYHLKHHHRVPF